MLIICCVAGCIPDAAPANSVSSQCPTCPSLNILRRTFDSVFRSEVYAAGEPSGPGTQGNSESKPVSISPAQKVSQMQAEAVKLYRQGDYEKALALARDTVEFCRNALGENTAEYATSLDNLASIYKETGKYDKAEPLFKQALDLRRKIVGENDPDFVISLNNLAGLYAMIGRYAEAEALYTQAMGIIRAISGEDNAFFIRCMNNLASLYKSMGDYVDVEPLYIKMQELLRKTSGENQREYAIFLSNIAGYYAIVGRYSEADSLYNQSLEITRKTLGEQSLQYARTLNNLGSLNEEMGNYDKAEPFYQQAVAIFITTSGKNGPDVAAGLNNLAGLYKTIGDYKKAETFYFQANEIWRSLFGEKHPSFASGLHNLADLYYTTRKFEAASQTYEKALDIQRACLGEQNPDVALTMQNLAVVYKKMGRYQEAETLFKQALEIWKPVLGDRHPNVALGLHNLAALYQGMGKYTEAEPLYRQALEIRSAAMGNNHPDVSESLNNLAALCAATARPKEALKLMEEAQNITDVLIRHVFAMASESQRLGYLAVVRGDMDAFLSLIAGHASELPTAATAGLDLVLKRKAIVAEAMAAERDVVLGGRYPDLQNDLLKLRTLSAQIAQKMMSGPGPEGKEAHQQMLEKWKDEKERLEVFLAGRIPEIDLEKKLMESNRHTVAAAIPASATLVEYVRFNFFDFNAIAAQGQRSWKPARYLAFVLSSGEPENISMIDLGEADVIDRKISDFRGSITGESENRGGRGIVTRSEPKVHGDAGADLRKAIFDPLAQGLQGHKRLLLAPDGDLYRVPFYALPTDTGERRIIDDYLISYVGAGRDILRFGMVSRLEPSVPLVLADPDYDLAGAAPAGEAGEAVSGERRSRGMFKGVPHFQRLPGTHTEGEHIASMLDIKAREGKLASKEQLKEARSPRILHIATHGFFLPDESRARDPKGSPPELEKGASGPKADSLSEPVENPLLRSGLVLAGANAWLDGRQLPPEDGDGILTGEDASALDLLSTDLVVLSACETGLGDIKIGEGVFGLRRAFLLAGGKTLVMSLWKVPDAQTLTLMEGFYKRILDGESRAIALREAQLAVKAVFAEPAYWAAFICQGDPGPLPATGKKK